MSNIKLTLTGDWERAAKFFGTIPQVMPKAISEAIRKEAEYLAGEMKKRFASLSPPLSPNTLLTKRRGGSKPLIASGDLRNSIGVVMQGDFKAVIGVSRSERGARLAAIHENGRVIVQQMTEKQRRFLHVVLPRRESTGGGGILVIHIPPRPFIKPTFEAEKDKVGPRILERIEQRLKAVQ